MPEALILFADCRELYGVYYNRAYSLVSDKRRKHIDSLKFDKNKRLSLSASVLLLYALKIKYSISPDEVIISCEKNGKPILRLNKTLKEKEEIYFNISHSGDYAMCVIGDCKIGCDIEKISAYKSDVAKRFFNYAESQYLESIGDPEIQKTEFYRIWTKKESFIKLTGDGLSRALSSFCVPFSDGSLSIDEKAYYFSHVNCIQGYSASVCTEKKINFGTSLVRISDLFKLL